MMSSHFSGSMVSDALRSVMEFHLDRLAATAQDSSLPIRSSVCAAMAASLQKRTQYRSSGMRPPRPTVSVIISRSTHFARLAGGVNDGAMMSRPPRPLPREDAVVLAPVNDEPAVALTRHH